MLEKQLIRENRGGKILLETFPGIMHPVKQIWANFCDATTKKLLIINNLIYVYNKGKILQDHMLAFI